MLEKDEFDRWIKASHIMFEIFEGRYDAYPMAKNWVQEWLSRGIFVVQKDHIGRISNLIENFPYDVYGVNSRLKKKIDDQIKTLLRECIIIGTNKNVGFAISFYLFTWNFRRFKKYFLKKQDFSVKLYFKKLGEFIEEKKKEFKFFRKKRLIYESIDREGIKRIFNKLNDTLRELGIGNNEPVGVIKLLHIFAPFYFPLIDNEIAKTVGLISRSRWESLTFLSYLKWMKALQNWLQNYVETIGKIENEYRSSILKLIDEGLYMMSTVKQRIRVSELGIKVR